MDVIDEFGHVELLGTLSRISLLLCIDTLQALTVCINIYLVASYIVSPFSEIVYNSKEFFILDWSLVLCSRDGFCMELNMVELFVSIDDLICRKDTSYNLIASIGFHNSLERSVALGEDGS